jgi:hypothetical protein
MGHIDLNLPGFIRRKLYPKLNFLKDTQCYLIGHMQYSNGQSWRDKFTIFAEQMGVKIYDPYHKPFIQDIPEDENSRQEMKHWMITEQYDLVANRMKKVRGYDLRCCDKCDWFVAVIKPQIASWGSAEEITTVIREKKPLFLVIDDPLGKRATPLWLMGVMPHKYIYNDIEEVMGQVSGINSGLIRANSDRWKLFKPEKR